MRVQQEKIPFQPVTIVLESELEANIVYDALDSYQGGSKERKTLIDNILKSLGTLIDNW